MVIRKIKLHNFRQFDEALIEFEGHGIELFLGTAGSGKTTIAEAIKWALSECGYSQFADTSIINIDIVKKAMLAEIMEASVELELSDQEHTYKVYKVLRGKKEPRNKYTVVDIIYHLYIQKCDGELSECKEKMILPNGYEKLMFASNDEISSITRRDGLKKYIEGANVNLQVVFDAYEYCRLCKRDIHMRLPSSNALSEYKNKLELLDKRIRQIKGEKYCLEEEKENYKTKLSELYAMLNVTETSIMDMQEPTDVFSQNMISEIRQLKYRVFDIEKRLAEELLELAKLEKMSKKLEIQNDKLIEDERITKWHEELKYLDALEKWIEEHYENKQKMSFELVEKRFQDILINIGIENCYGCSLEEAFDSKIECSSWKRELYYLALVFACRDVFSIETEEDNAIVTPLILDFNISGFGKYEGEKVIRYLTGRFEQIIFISHPNVEYFGDASGIRYSNNIISNDERTMSRIEKRG